MTNIIVAPTKLTQLENLVGKSVSGLNLAASMLTVQFGNKVTNISSKGKKREVGELALHIQSSWRITNKNQIIVGIDDYYGIDEKDSLGLITPVLNDIVKQNLKVISIELIEPSSFILKLTNTITISAFSAAGIIGNETEAWRLFNPSKDTKHFVVMSDGVKK